VRRKWYLGGIALKTVYVTFDPPKIAAVKMLNRPPFFGTWAASLRHEDLGDGQSRVTYTFTFTAKPRTLRFILEPLMGIIFELETWKRLRALKRHFERRAIFPESTPGAEPASCPRQKRVSLAWQEATDRSQEWTKHHSR